MATTLTVRINNTDADLAYGASGAGYVDLDLDHDYLIWTAGSDDVKDGEDEPTADELNSASTLIDASSEVQVAHCLLFDYSLSGGGALDEVVGMGENKKYVFDFNFSGDTASEPQLEAWDDDNHSTSDKHVLGAGTPSNSMLKGVCTTNSLPGANWAKTGGTHTEVAGSGASNIIQLNDGNGAISLASGESSRNLYANLAVVIPAGYATPAVETFVLTCRYTWN